MMSKNSFLLVLVCMILVGLAQASPLDPFNKRQGAPGSVAYADFEGKCSGRFTWTNTPEAKCRVTGQFNTGFSSPNIEDYEFHLEDDAGKVIQDLTKEIRSKVSINVPGTSPFECDFPFSFTSVADVKGLCFVVILKGKPLDKGFIKKV